MAHHMIDEDRMFISAARFSLWDLRLRLAFFPLVGRWFALPEDTTEDEDA
jgi:hypothetical protein